MKSYAPSNNRLSRLFLSVGKIGLELPYIVLGPKKKNKGKLLGANDNDETITFLFFTTTWK